MKRTLFLMLLLLVTCQGLVHAQPDGRPLPDIETRHKTGTALVRAVTIDQDLLDVVMDMRAMIPDELAGLLAAEILRIRVHEPRILADGRAVFSGLEINDVLAEDVTWTLANDWQLGDRHEVVEVQYTRLIDGGKQ